MKKKSVIIMGAAGRDFHNFNVCFKDKENYEVVAFTATQIPNIADRKYPSELAGKLYPEGIAIYDERELIGLIKEYKVDDVVFSYSDVPYEYVMHKA
ncbi:MAG: GTPase, partial [Candidatus Scalindua sp.]|nr:GTPase [Candidatus Scalindua sp.]